MGEPEGDKLADGLHQLFQVFAPPVSPDNFRYYLDFAGSGVRESGALGTA